MEKEITINVLESLGLRLSRLSDHTIKIYEYYEGGFEDEIIVKVTISLDKPKKYDIYMYNRETGQKFSQICFYTPYLIDMYNGLKACQIETIANKLKDLCE